MEKEHKLAGGSLGVAESVIMGIAGTAPAFSIEVTASTIIVATGVLSTASILYSGLIMFGITFAYINLNKMNAHAGAAFAWVGQIFGKTMGFFAGWALLVASSLFMVSGTIPAANAFLLVFAPDKVNDVHVITIIAAMLLTFISFVVLKGIKLTSYVQVAMTVVEIIILAIIAVASFIVFPKIAEHPFAWNWFSIIGFTPATFANGALVAMFFYWGWDVVMNLNEETKDPEKTAGKGALWAMTYLLIFFVIFIVIVLLGLSDAEIQHYNTNVIYAVAEKLYGNTFGLMAIIAVLLSTVGTLETSILQFTRTLFAKGRAGALHPRYAKVHHKWKTPYVAVFFIWGFGMALLLLSSYIPTVNEILKSFISAIGFQIAFYLGLAGFACAWYYRKMLKANPLGSITHVIWPALSAGFLFFIAIYSVPTFDTMTTILGLGGIAIGIVPFWANKLRNK
ncbi:MAG: APC family permease [Candidatus Yonathbacteria bacterium]|nr:APC family permease [Candidatus Yonathbacteria bacterium]